MHDKEDLEDDDMPKKKLIRKKIKPGDLNKVIWYWAGGMFAVIMVAALIANNRGRSKQAATSENIARLLKSITVSVCTNTMTQAGIIVGPQMVLTNLHILNNGDNCIIRGTAPEKYEYPASVLRSDPINDLTLLQVQTGKTLPVARLGNSNIVDRGDIVYSMGRAYGKSNFFTYGIISDNNFNFATSSGNYCGMFRTNIFVYDGTCGSPLVNIRGEVIGINTSIAYPDNQFTGIGYATPINKAVALLQNRRPQTPYTPPNPYTPLQTKGFGGQGNPYSLA